MADIVGLDPDTSAGTATSVWVGYPIDYDDKCTFISKYNSSSSDSIITKVEFELNQIERNPYVAYVQPYVYEINSLGSPDFEFLRHDSGTKAEITHEFLEYSGGDYKYKFSSNSSKVTFEGSATLEYWSSTYGDNNAPTIEFIDQHIPIDNGDYIGITVQDIRYGLFNPNNDVAGYTLVCRSGLGGESYIFKGHKTYYSTIQETGNYQKSLVAQCIFGTGATSGLPTNTCRTYTTNLYDEDTYNGWATVKVKDFDDVADEVAVDITLPWGEFKSFQAIGDNTTRTWVNPDNDREKYSLTPDIFFGAPPFVDDLKECWWAETGSLFVSPKGDDTNNFGVSWDKPYRTLTKANGIAQADSTINIRSAQYPSETQLYPSNSGVSYAFYDYNENDDVNKTMVSGDNPFWSDGQRGRDDFYEYIYGYTAIDSYYNTITSNGTIEYFDVCLSRTDNTGSQCKLKIFRDGGTTWDFIGESELITLGSYDHDYGSDEYTWEYLPCDIDVLAGDHIGLYVPSGSTAFKLNHAASISSPESQKNVKYSGDITTNVTKASGTTYNRGNMGVIVRGIN